MTVVSKLLRTQTEGHGEIVDLTAGLRSILSDSGVKDGLLTVFAIGSTVAITTMEYEHGAKQDLTGLLERLIPARGDYEHNRLNGDTNGYAHMRAAVIGPSETIPFVGGELALGTWQQVVLVDFDDRPRQRTVAVHLVS